MVSPRTLKVLGSLIIGMSLTAGALAWLEPQMRPPGPAIPGMRLIDEAQARLIRQTDLPIEPEHWKSISLSRGGRQTEPSAAHAGTGRNPESFHFIVDDGGHVWVGDLWRDQRWRAANDPAIHILLTGNPDVSRPAPAQLDGASRLVSALQFRCGCDAPAEAILN